MLFTDPLFLFGFLPAVLALFYVVPVRHKILALSLSSLVFYAYFKWEYVLIIGLSMAVNHLLACVISERRSPAVLAAGIAFNLLLLALFKYVDFISTSVTWAVGVTPIVFGLVLPLGISFFTFEQISYLVDLYRRDVKRRNFRDYAFFILFFPHLIAGPIIRAKEIYPQIDVVLAPPRRRMVDFSIGITLFVIGFFKKVVIADKLGFYADPVFQAAAGGLNPTFPEVWAGVLAYSFQIYFDFSGYSDMALGLARLFGFRLPVNFLSPYQAPGIIEFWRRWNMSLSRFIRDYLYFPLGGGRLGHRRQWANILVVMSLVGLWHGAGWSFIVWGALHGVMLIINHAWRSIRPRQWVSGRWGAAAGWLVTFLAVTLAWVPFRAADMATAMQLWQTSLGLNGVVLPVAAESLVGAGGAVALFPHALFDNSAYAGLIGLFGVSQPFPLLPLAALIAFALPNAYQWIDRYQPGLDYARERGNFQGFAWRPHALLATGLVVMFLAALWSQGAPNEFIYFQF